MGKMEIKTLPQQLKKDKSLGRAKKVVDCTAEEAAAWYFAFCSRERMSDFRENEANSARIEIRERETKGNEKIFAHYQHLPFPLSTRGEIKFCSSLHPQSRLTDSHYRV